MDAAILITPHWDLEFHVHYNASNLVMETMLAHNIMNKCNQQISYVFLLLNKAKQNYTSSKHETLIILCREYLIQKLQISRGIAQIFFSMDFW